MNSPLTSDTSMKLFLEHLCSKGFALGGASVVPRQTVNFSLGMQISSYFEVIIFIQFSRNCLLSLSLDEHVNICMAGLPKSPGWLRYWVRDTSMTGLKVASWCFSSVEFYVFASK